MIQPEKQPIQRTYSLDALYSAKGVPYLSIGDTITFSNGSVRDLEKLTQVLSDDLNAEGWEQAEKTLREKYGDEYNTTGANELIRQQEEICPFKELYTPDGGSLKQRVTHGFITGLCLVEALLIEKGKIQLNNNVNPEFYGWKVLVNGRFNLSGTQAAKLNFPYIVAYNSDNVIRFGPYAEDTQTIGSIYHPNIEKSKKAVKVSAVFAEQGIARKTLQKPGLKYDRKD